MPSYRMFIEQPGPAGRRIPPRRHIGVSGRIESDGPLPKGAVFSAYLLSAGGETVRHTSAPVGDCEMVLPFDGFIGYPGQMDPGYRKLRSFGFPELRVTDPKRPEQSLRNATIKAFSDGLRFKTFFVGATDVSHGLIFDDGMNFTDENGQPYTFLPEGEYRIRVSLSTKDGELCSDSQNIIIGGFEKTLICRINPLSHRRRMYEWAKEQHLAAAEDVIPGYLEPYLGVWLYHMGLLRMYLSGDIALYATGQANLFVYLITPTSTSLTTELAFLQKSGAVGDPARFRAWYYDIGEAELFAGGKKVGEGRITEGLEAGEMHIQRMDTVDGGARENVYELDGRHATASRFRTDTFHAKAGERIAFAGVLLPYQTDPEGYVLRQDNTYDIKELPKTVRYTFTCGRECRTEERDVGMRRTDGGEDLGVSVYEFYNLFDADVEMAGKTWQVFCSVLDRDGRQMMWHTAFSLTVD